MERALSTCIKYGQGQVSRFRDRTMSVITTSPPVLLEVVKGAQTGSMSIVESNSFTIGSSLDDEIFLVDGDGVVTVDIRRTPIGTFVALTTDRDDVKFGTMLIKKKSDPIRLPCILSIAKTDIALSKAAESFKDDILLERRPHLQLVILGLFTLLSASLLFVQYQSKNSSISRGNVVDVSSVRSNPTPMSRVGALLDDSRFRSRVVLTQLDNATFSLSGTVPQHEQAAWQEFREELDRALIGYSLVSNVQVTPPLTNLPAVSIVVSSPNPFVVLSGGRKVAIGDTFIDGWILTEINETELIVARNGYKTALTY